jgi:hypothetical protein
MIFFLREDTSYDDRDYINFTERLLQFFLRLWDGLWHKDVVDDSAGQLAARI